MAVAQNVAADTGQETSPVKLTILLPFSGVFKHSGIDAKNGFFLGIEQESAHRGIEFDKWVEFDMIDSKTDLPDESLERVKTSIAQGSQAILGVLSSATGMAIADSVLNEAKIPLIVFGASATPKLRTSNPLFLRTTFSTEHFTLGLTLWCKEHPPVPSTGQPLRWACIHADFGAGAAFCNSFKRGYDPVGEEVGRVPIPFNTVNKKKYLIQLSKLKPDFAFAFFGGLETEPFIRDYYRFRVHKKIPLLMIGNALTPQLLKNLEDVLEQHGAGIGLTSSSSWFPHLDNSANKTFVALYQKTYKRLPSTYAMHGYDAGRLLVKALYELNGNWDGPKVMHLMRTLPIESPRHGKQLRFDAHGDPIVPMYIFMIKRDGDRLVNEFVGETPFINLDDYIQ